MSEPSPARLAVQGFTQLATWYTQLVGDHVARVAETMAGGRFDADAAAAAWTRSLALPFLGLTALANEVVDATALQTAGVPTTGVPGHRVVESEVFAARADGEVVLTPGPLTNGFEDELAGVEVVRMDGRKFKLVARAVPSELVGVFRGEVVVGGDEQHPQPVWLVVP